MGGVQIPSFEDYARRRSRRQVATAKRFRLTHSLCDFSGVLAAGVHRRLGILNNPDAIFIRIIAARPLFDAPIFTAIRNHRTRTLLKLSEIATSTVPWMFHRRTYHLKARRRLDRRAEFVFSKDSEKFRLFRLLLDDHQFFFNRHALCGVVTSRSSELFL